MTEASSPKAVIAIVDRTVAVAVCSAQECHGLTEGASPHDVVGGIHHAILIVVSGQMIDDHQLSEKGLIGHAEEQAGGHSDRLRHGGERPGNAAGRGENVEALPGRRGESAEEREIQRPGKRRSAVEVQPVKLVQRDAGELEERRARGGLLKVRALHLRDGASGSEAEQSLIDHQHAEVGGRDAIERTQRAVGGVDERGGSAEIGAGLNDGRAAIEHEIAVERDDAAGLEIEPTRRAQYRRPADRHGHGHACRQNPWTHSRGKCRCRE